MSHSSETCIQAINQLKLNGELSFDIAQMPLPICGLQIKRNCSGGPFQLISALGFLSLVTLIIGLGFLVVGVPWVLVFAMIEVLVMAICFFVYAKHVTDKEILLISDYQLFVIKQMGKKIESAVFNRAYVWIEWDENTNQSIKLSSSGRGILVGDLLNHQAREVLYSALKKKFRHAPASKCVDELHTSLNQYGVIVSPLG